MLSVINPSQFVGSFSSRNSGLQAPDFGFYNGYGATNNLGGGSTTFSGVSKHRSKSSMSDSPPELYFNNLQSGTRPSSSLSVATSKPVASSASSVMISTSAASQYTHPSSIAQNSNMFNNKTWSNGFHPGYRTTANSVSGGSTKVSTSTSRSMLTANTVSNQWMFPSAYSTSCAGCNPPMQSAGSHAGSKMARYDNQYSQTAAALAASAHRAHELEHHRRKTASGMRNQPAPPAMERASNKDYSKPLFVDCSIEYELPNAPKIPKNSEPILMIHPAYKKVDKISHQPLTPPLSQDRKILTARRSCGEAKKLSPSAVENCSGIVNRPNHVFPLNQAANLKSEEAMKQAYRQQMYLRQQQQQLQQHQESLKAAASLNLEFRRRMAAPQKKMQQPPLQHHPKSHPMPPHLGGGVGSHCVSLNCQCFEAVNYRRRLLDPRRGSQLHNQHMLMNNNNNIVKPLMGPPLAPPDAGCQRPMKRSYAEAAMMVDPGYLYHKSQAAAMAVAQQQLQHQQLYPTAFKQGRFSLY